MLGGVYLGRPVGGGGVLPDDLLPHHYGVAALVHRQPISGTAKVAQHPVTARVLQHVFRLQVSAGKLSISTNILSKFVA